MIPASGNVLLAGGDDGYKMDKSLRFRASASAYLNRTPASAGNRQIWTWSGWVKRGKLDVQQNLFAGGIFGNSFGDYTIFGFNADNTINIGQGIFGLSTDFNINTTAVYRDISAWYHIVLSVDTTQATASNRLRLYINNVSVSLSGQPTQNINTNINAVINQTVGSANAANANFDGYLADVNFIDGQALTPASFGETNTLTGVWQPAPYTGTYGTNGFYLDFEDTSSVAALGTDTSGNGNNWTVNNVSLTAGVTYDSMTDVPTLTSDTTSNYCVMNPLNFGTACSPTPMTVTGGNLNWSYNRSSSGSTWMPGTIQVPPNSKIYFEFVQTSASSSVGASFGICYTNLRRDSSNPTIWRTINAFNGNKFSDTVNTAYGTSFAVNDICGVAVDLVNGKIFFSKNGVWQGSADPVAGTNAAFTDLVSSGYSWLPVVYGSGGDSNAGSANFGQRPFAYTPPTGFVALNTFNLPTATILKGSNEMDIALDTGANIKTTAEAEFTGSQFLEWIKDRANANNHQLLDSVRGLTAVLQSNTTAAETTYTAPSGNSVGWVWKAGASAVSNTDGTITSTVSANTTAGFSVATYTANGTTGSTFGHGLGIAPAFVILKSRTVGGGDWFIYHQSLGGTKGMYLNLANAAATSSAFWNNTAPSSTVVTVGSSASINTTGSTNVAYCFAEIAGFSKFGNYTGNGSADGTFVYTGFRPKAVIIVNSSAAENWRILDTSRSPSNVASAELYPSLANAEATNAVVDILSNGFKVRTTSSAYNTSGNNYIYAAFAENPFKNSLAR